MSQDRVFGNPSEQWELGQQPAGVVPVEHRRLVKPESIHVHLVRPIAECGQDMVLHHGMAGIDGIAGSGKILVVALVVRQRVKDRVIHSAETERRPQLVSLRRMIEHHVQNHFDAGLVKCLDHFLELQLLPAQTCRTAVGSFGRKVRHGIIAPVIFEPLIGLRIPARDRIFIELLHRHQFHRRHAQGFEIGNLFHQTPVGSRMVNA